MKIYDCVSSASEQFYADIKNQLTLSMEADFYFLQKPFSNEELVRQINKILA